MAGTHGKRQVDPLPGEDSDDEIDREQGNEQVKSRMMRVDGSDHPVVAGGFVAPHAPIGKLTIRRDDQRPSLSPQSSDRFSASESCDGGGFAAGANMKAVQGDGIVDLERVEAFHAVDGGWGRRWVHSGAKVLLNPRPCAKIEGVSLAGVGAIPEAT